MSHLKPTPEQEAALTSLLREYVGGYSAAMFAHLLWARDKTPTRIDGRTVRAWLRCLLVEGKIRRVSTRPERWGLA
jgi:hypothetical protein